MSSEIAKFKSSATNWGCEHEKAAISKYLKLQVFAAKSTKYSKVFATKSTKYSKVFATKSTKYSKVFATKSTKYSKASLSKFVTVVHGSFYSYKTARTSPVKELELVL